MTELATVDTAPEPEPYLPVASPLAIWADSARRAASVAVSLAKTPFVPQSLRGADAGTTAANITAAILTGQEVGLEPMAALRSIDVIQGTPAMRAVALRALVQSKGHSVWVVEQTDTRAVVAGKRRGDDHEQKSVWTMDRAKALGLAGKDNWRKQPQAMLVARATGELCRLIAADVILGVPYAVEELEDGITDPTVTPADAAPAAGRRTARRAPRADTPPIETPEPDPTPDPVPDAPAAAEPVADVAAEGDQLWPEPPADWKPDA